MLTCTLCACDSGTDVVKEKQLVTDWRLTIHLPDVALPVQLHLAADASEAWFVNGAEKVVVPEVSVEADTIKLYFPSFNNTLILHRKGTQLNGSLTLVKRGYEQVMQVTGEADTGYRFQKDAQAASDFTGRWEVTFVNKNGGESIAIGEFDQQGSQVTGTFLTPTGDYRYLAGEVDDNRLRLSTFDGAHAFVFTAHMQTDGSVNGDFWSGTSWHESWSAHRNFDAQLPDAYSLTYLKEGYDRIEFSLPDLDGQQVSLADNKYRDKVVLVTLSGTWCPNCADEAAFLSAYFRDNKERGLEIITLLYEHFEEFERAAQQGRALRSEFGIEYDLLVAGISDKTQASETLPMMSRVLAFPTMIFIDRKGNVRNIHTGFSGPGTGQHYQQFVTGFNVQMDELLDEGA
jgi:peroxiredoxin